MPVRIQRKRTKGWRMPDGVVYVGRPGKFGNPYDTKYYPIEDCIALFRNTACGIWDPAMVAGMEEWLAEQTYQHHLQWRLRLTLETIRAELQGKDLACWCPLDKPCHADVLLELANETDRRAQ
jgi:Domain of unknown function (DUF4326)